MTIRVVRDQSAPMRHEIHIDGNSIATDASVEQGGEGAFNGTNLAGNLLVQSNRNRATKQ